MAFSLVVLIGGVLTGGSHWWFSLVVLTGGVLTGDDDDIGPGDRVCGFNR